LFCAAASPWSAALRHEAKVVLRDGVPLIGQDAKVLHCRRVVTIANRSLTVLKRPCHCCAEQRERENAASKESCDLLLHGSPF
jgi:hypothetical protein